MNGDSKQRTVFVVLRIGLVGFVLPHPEETERGIPIAVFSTELEANALRDSLQLEFETQGNPFLWVHPFGEVENNLLAVLDKHKIARPVPVKRNSHNVVWWNLWWDENTPYLTGIQKDAIRSCLDLLTVYRVDKTTMEL